MSNQNPPPGNQGNQDWGNQSGHGSQNPYAAPSGGDQQGRPADYQQRDAYQQQESSGGSGLAITALVLGILAILGLLVAVGGFLFGIPAIIVGFIASGRAKKGRAKGRGMAITGIVLGAIALLLNILAVVGLVALFSSETGGTYVECVQEASSQSEIEQCALDFEQDVQG